MGGGVLVGEIGQKGEGGREGRRHSQFNDKSILGRTELVGWAMPIPMTLMSEMGIKKKKGSREKGRR